MKNLNKAGVRFTASLILLLGSGCNVIQTGPLLEPSNAYTIDTWGINLKVYEFTPRSNKNYTCVSVMFVVGGDPSLQCFPKSS